MSSVALEVRQPRLTICEGSFCSFHNNNHVTLVEAAKKKSKKAKTAKKAIQKKNTQGVHQFFFSIRNHPPGTDTILQVLMDTWNLCLMDNRAQGGAPKET